MKRILALLLSVLLLFSFAGAGTPIAGEDPEPSAAPIWSDEHMFSLGTINGDTYENQYLGYGCKLEGWTFADAGTIATMNQFASATMSEDIQELYRSSASFTEMYASSADGLKSVNIQYQNIEKMYGNTIDGLDLDALMQVIAPQLPSVLEQSGYSGVTVEAGSVSIGNDVHPGVIINGTVSGLKCYQKQACIRTDEYIIYLCATSFQTDTTDEILSLFYPLTGTIYVSPADKLNLVIRVPNENWKAEEDASMVTFTNSASASGENYVGILSEDMSFLSEDLQTASILDVAINSMLEEALAEASDADFSEISDCLVGGKYNGRITSGTLKVDGIDAAMNANFVGWFAESHLYLALTLCGAADDAETSAFLQSILNSFQTATAYAAESGEAQTAPAA